MTDKARIEQLEAENERLRETIAEAYQIVGALAVGANIMDDLAVIRALDILSGLLEGSMLPFTLPPRNRSHDR